MGIALRKKPNKKHTELQKQTKTEKNLRKGKIPQAKRKKRTGNF